MISWRTAGQSRQESDDHLARSPTILPIAGPTSSSRTSPRTSFVGELVLFALYLVLLLAALRVALRGLPSRLARLGRWRGIAFGFLLLLTFGALLFDVKPDSATFRRYGLAAVNVALFAALFLVFGLVVAPVADGLDRALPRRRPAHLWTWAAYAEVGLAGVAGTVFVAAAIGSAVASILAGNLGFEPLALTAAPLAVALAARRISPIAPRARAAAYVLVATPVLVGLPFTLRAIVALIGSVVVSAGCGVLVPSGCAKGARENPLPRADSISA